MSVPPHKKPFSKKREGTSPVIAIRYRIAIDGERLRQWLFKKNYLLPASDPQYAGPGHEPLKGLFPGFQGTGMFFERFWYQKGFPGISHHKKKNGFRIRKTDLPFAFIVECSAGNVCRVPRFLRTILIILAGCFNETIRYGKIIQKIELT